ncbi:hypothetical protein LCGC14_2507480 [marine sediment metagenome]|uniref:Uncharacterized protein n=1 Tax=marine sediment metagenome TaxID=412755 RepID=A0A0F9B0W7_9ZZZZ
MPMSYNRLQGNTREWAFKNNQPRAEYANRVTRGKEIKGNPSLSLIAGNGKYGFHSRRHAEDPVRMVKGKEGQYTKFRKSVARKKKNVSRLCPTKYLSYYDPIAVAIREEQTKRMQRRRNRNGKARRGRKLGV